MEQVTQDLMKQLIDRMERAELALNRHGFRDEGEAGWQPGVAKWSSGAALRDYLSIHYPEVMQGHGDLFERSQAALELAGERYNEACSRWIRCTVPNLNLANVRASDRNDSGLREALFNAEEMVNRAIMERDAARAELAHYTKAEHAA